MIIFTHDKFSSKQIGSKSHKVYILKNNDAQKYINLFNKHVYYSGKKRNLEYDEKR